MTNVLLAMFVPFGRASRPVYLAGFGLLMLAMPFVMQALIYIIPRDMFGMPVFMPFLMLPNLWIMWCLMVNRLHDLNRSGAWAILPIVLPLAVMSVSGGFTKDAIGWGQIMSMFWGPALFMALALLLLFFKGSTAPNRFGERRDIALS